ncbi:MAG: imidazole glycerol phosphate synthase subunit HisH [Planctomycetota bacterium]|jgi:glutamine amidotransferase|nr:imidazole glycerol phosphate synthase subunit HisH [Planctomycetota bacterium]MDP7251407.1 imidazole glycerol phosphate synthase subunit HisH [Planctomycetota bacterium]
MIAITDYGMGNLRSVQKALESLGAKAEITSDPQRIADADKVILPGVGAFEDAMDELAQRELIEPIKDAAREKPLLGICLGLQLIFDESEEDGLHQGLGLVPGRVVRFEFEQNGAEPKLKIPHMGWNALEFKKDIPLFKGIDSGVYTYFVHSFYAVPASDHVVAATADYGRPFAAVVASGNVYATQFHPEKSQAKGLKMLENFIGL